MTEECYISDDIPSDAEAEARLHSSQPAGAQPEEDEKSESLGVASSIGTCYLCFQTDHTHIHVLD